MNTRPIWPECVIVQEPLKKSDKPTLLVKRREGRLCDAMGNELCVIPGHPVISLFTGCGGMDIGVEQAGFTTLVQHEWAEAACQTLIGNRPNFFRHSALIQGDLRQTPTSMLLGAAGLRVGQAHLLTGGPPCQGFSAANRHSHTGTYDARNDLVFEFLRVVRESQPHFFCMENVEGFVRFNKGEYLSAFLRAAHGCYYELVYALIDCCEHGVPQHRVRFLCMGTRRDLFDCDGQLGAMPKPTHFGAGDLKLIKTLDEIRDAAELRSICRPPGIRYFPDRPMLFPPSPRHNNSDGRRPPGFREFYDRLEREEPDRLVTEVSE